LHKYLSHGYQELGWVLGMGHKGKADSPCPLPGKAMPGKKVQDGLGGHRGRGEPLAACHLIPGLDDKLHREDYFPIQWSTTPPTANTKPFPEERLELSLDHRLAKSTCRWAQ
jgi:hypothetical protein